MLVVMASPLRSLLPLLLCFAAFLLLGHHVLIQPSCGTSPPPSASSLRVMVVADLHLAGPRTAWVDRVRRESFMRSTLRTALRQLSPDALIVLGDLSDEGRKSSDAQWNAVVARFRELLLPFSQASVPIQIVVGNHDVGDHHDPGFSTRLTRFAASFPGLDETCGSHLTWNGINFVSLNAIALQKEGCSVCSKRSELGFPVLLSHLPLYRVDENACSAIDIPGCALWHDLEGPCLPLGFGISSAREELDHRVGQDVVSAINSARVLQSFRPRLVLSGHTHRWCDRVHADGTREVTVPSLSWRNRDDPGFAFLTFEKNASNLMLQRCLLARESTMIGVYVLWGCTVVSSLVVGVFAVISRFRSKSVKPE